jgi:hypothetical protein
MMLGWRMFCVLAFALFAAGTVISYFARKERPTTGTFVTHIAAWPAIGFSLPVLFFNQGSLRIIGPLSIFFCLVFFASVLVGSRQKKPAGTF